MYSNSNSEETSPLPSFSEVSSRGRRRNEEEGVASTAATTTTTTPSYMHIAVMPLPVLGMERFTKNNVMLSSLITTSTSTTTTTTADETVWEFEMVDSGECVQAIQEQLGRQGITGKKTTVAAVNQLERAKDILSEVREGEEG